MDLAEVFSGGPLRLGVGEYAWLIGSGLGTSPRTLQLAGIDVTEFGDEGFAFAMSNLSARGLLRETGPQPERITEVFDHLEDEETMPEPVGPAMVTFYAASNARGWIRHMISTKDRMVSETFITLAEDFSLAAIAGPLRERTIAPWPRGAELASVLQQLTESSLAQVQDASVSIEFLSADDAATSTLYVRSAGEGEYQLATQHGDAAPEMLAGTHSKGAVADRTAGMLDEFEASLNA